MRELEIVTCGPFYDDDRRKVEEEIVDALKEQGYRVTKNAVGDHSCAGPGDDDGLTNNNSEKSLNANTLRPPNATIHCKKVGPDLWGRWGTGE